MAPDEREDVLARLTTGDLPADAPEAQAAFARDPDLRAAWLAVEAIARTLDEEGRDVRAVRGEGRLDHDALAMHAVLARVVERELPVRGRQRSPWWIVLAAAALALLAVGWFAWRGGADLPAAPAGLLLGGDEGRADVRVVPRARLRAIAWQAVPGVERYTFALRGRTEDGGAELLPPQRVAVPELRLPPDVVASLPRHIEWTVSWIADDGQRETRSGRLELVD